MKLSSIICLVLFLLLNVARVLSAPPAAAAAASEAEEGALDDADDADEGDEYVGEEGPDKPYATDGTGVTDSTRSRYATYLDPGKKWMKVVSAPPTSPQPPSPPLGMVYLTDPLLTGTKTRTAVSVTAAVIEEEEDLPLGGVYITDPDNLDYPLATFSVILSCLKGVFGSANRTVAAMMEGVGGRYRHPIPSPLRSTRYVLLARGPMNKLCPFSYAHVKI